GNTRDQTSTVYEAQIPRGHLGWGNVSTLGFSLAGAVAAKLAYPNRQSVLVTGDAGVCYMMGNFEAVARYKIGVTVLHINNGGYSGYGPGFWGGGHDPYTWKVSDHASACMANMAKAVGFHAEDVSAPGEIIPALKRALDENAKGRPAFLEFMASHHPVHGGWLRPSCPLGSGSRVGVRESVASWSRRGALHAGAAHGDHASDAPGAEGDHDRALRGGAHHLQADLHGLEAHPAGVADHDEQAGPHEAAQGVEGHEAVEGHPREPGAVRQQQ